MSDGQALTESQVLSLFDAGRHASGVDRTELLIDAAKTDGGLPNPRGHEGEQWLLGAVERRLMDCREATYGRILAALAHCPHCGEEVTFDLDLREFRQRSDPSSRPLVVTSTDSRWRVTFRLPTLGDLRSASEAESSDEARDRFVQRCVLSAHYDGDAVDWSAVPENVLATVIETMAEHDPQADIRLILTCPACASGWELQFDMTSFLWREIEGHARAVLAQVHVLAYAYGWTEEQVLALAPARRRAYIEMVLA